MYSLYNCLLSLDASDRVLLKLSQWVFKLVFFASKCILRCFFNRIFSCLLIQGLGLDLEICLIGIKLFIHFEISCLIASQLQLVSLELNEALYVSKESNKYFLK